MVNCAPPFARPFPFISAAISAPYKRISFDVLPPRGTPYFNRAIDAINFLFCPLEARTNVGKAAVRANRLSLACRYLPRENGGPIMYTGNLGKSFEKRGSGSRSRYSRPWRTCPANSEITRRPHERINKLSRGKGPTITPRCSIPVFPLGPFLQGEIMNFDIQPASGVMKFSSHLSSRLLFPSTTFISTRVRGTKFISLARMVVVDGKITRPITYR